MTLSHIVVNVSLSLTNTTIWFVAAVSLIVDVRTYVQTYRQTDIFMGLLGHLGGDDLKMCSEPILGYLLSAAIHKSAQHGDPCVLK